MSQSIILENNRIVRVQFDPTNVEHLTAAKLILDRKPFGSIRFQQDPKFKDTRNMILEVLAAHAVSKVPGPKEVTVEAESTEVEVVVEDVIMPRIGGYLPRERLAVV